MNLIKNLAHDIINFVCGGCKLSSQEEYIRRLTICNNCPGDYLKNGRCERCGCYMNIKAKMSTTECPEDFW